MRPVASVCHHGASWRSRICSQPRRHKARRDTTGASRVELDRSLEVARQAVDGGDRHGAHGVHIVIAVDYRSLGRTGVQVSPLCLGAMMFGAWGNPDHDESIRIIHRALDAGVNFVDTADVYARGESEEIVGKVLEGRGDNVVLATKFHGTMGDDPN